MSRELAVRGERYPSRRDSQREGRREIPVYTITDAIPAKGILGTLRIDVSMPFLAHLIASLERYGAEVDVNLRAPREGPQTGYGTLTVRFPPNAGA